MTTFERRSHPCPEGRPRPAAGDVLRRRDRRAGGAVPGHLRELGGQGGVAARRRARSHPRRHAAGRPARRTGWARSSSAPRGPPAWWSPDTDDPDAVVCGPDVRGSRGRSGPPSCPVLACALLPLGVRFADPLPDGVHDVGRRGVVAAGRVRAVRPAGRRPTRRTTSAASTAPTPSCGARPPPVIWSPTAAGSCRWRTRLPHRVSPPSRSRSHGAAPWSWSLRPTGSGSRRRTSPSAPPLASLPERPGVG